MPNANRLLLLYLLVHVLFKGLFHNRIFLKYVELQLRRNDDLDLSVHSLRPRVYQLTRLSFSLTFLRSLREENVLWPL